MKRVSRSLEAHRGVFSDPGSNIGPAVNSVPSFMQVLGVLARA